MFAGKRILAIIPARGGSKGLPRKNIKPFLGRPLISWTIGQAKKSRYLDMIAVSTDDKRIASVARRYGAGPPFVRPKRFAADNSLGIDVIIHALDWFKKRGENFDIVVSLQPTSPLRLTGDIDRAVELLFSKKARAIVSVCETGHPPYWSNILPPNGSMKNFLMRRIRNMTRQQLPRFYRLNGAVYAGFCDYVRKNESFFGAMTFAYIMPKERSVDIDDELDFEFAELLAKKRHRVKK